MRRIPRRVVALLTVLALAVGITVAISPWSTTVPSLTQAQLRYMKLARQGIAQTSRWWDSKRHWYFAVLDDHQRRPLANLWDTNGLFEALDEIAIAQPTTQNLAAVTSFANGSERYWNRYLKPIPAYDPYPGDSSPRQRTWFDDNGWIGLAFLDAYKATGNSRYLSDAERAFTFIAAEGWDTRAGGGMWWDTAHPWRSGEALAAATDLAARLYQATDKGTYLRAAEKYLGWADRHLLQAHGVYLETACAPYPYLIEPKTPVQPPACSTVHIKTKCPPGPKGCKPINIGKCRPGVRRCTVLQRPPPNNGKVTMVAMPHDGEGAMLAAITALCEKTGVQRWCKAAEKLAASEIVWLAPFADGPQYDSVLVRGLLTLYAHDHKARWYRFAVAIAHLIEAHARTGPGIYLRGWDGRPVPSAEPGMLRTDAGSIAVFADLATVPPPT